ncbi:hypothetical protein OKW45_000467 [Paraburkholderia sp. WSM4175]
MSVNVSGTEGYVEQAAALIAIEPVDALLNAADANRRVVYNGRSKRPLP